MSKVISKQASYRMLISNSTTVFVWGIVAILTFKFIKIVMRKFIIHGQM
ncbi:hypothetical protein PV797_19835 [Clostridiaceae bacterium M8S5]|nr:hypothetical protein PV797_19835 [Clostridiaceae bacterium M8S5]